MRPRTRRAWKTVAIILAAFAAVYVVLTVWSMIALHNAYAALKRDGRPMTLAEVVPPPVPDAENAAPLYEQAIRVLTTAKESDRTLMFALSCAASDTSRTDAAPTAIERMNALLLRPETQQALCLVLQGSNRKDCRFDLDYEGTPMAIGSAELTELLDLIKIVRREVGRLSAREEITNAWHLVVAGERLAAAKEHEPALLSKLVTIAGVAIIDVSLHRLCSLAPPPREERDRIVALLGRMDQPKAFQKMVDGERVIFSDWGFKSRNYQSSPFLSETPSWHRFAIFSMWPGFMWRFDHAAYLRIMRDAPSAPLDWSFAEVEVPYYCPITRIILPALGGCGKQFIAHLARIRCTESGLAVLSYRSEHGAWPDSLAACMPQVSTDPFAAGQPLRYHTTDKGFIVSSVGKTGKPQKEIAWDFVPMTNTLEQGTASSLLRHDAAR